MVLTESRPVMEITADTKKMEYVSGESLANVWWNLNVDRHNAKIDRLKKEQSVKKVNNGI